MKIQIGKGVVVLTSETKEEAVEMASFAVGNLKENEATTKKFSCQYCGRTCKGKIGLAVHERKCKKLRPAVTTNLLG